MALTDCFIQPGSLQGLMTCLRESENLTGVAVVAGLLTAWLVIQLMAQRGRKAHRPEAMDGVPVTQTPERFGDEKHADRVFSFANRELYQLMLTEMEKVLTDTGYALTRNEAERVTMSEADRQKISRRIFRVRQCYITPRVSEQAMKDSEDAAVNDGYAGTWLSMLIRGSECEGWYITRRKKADVMALTEKQKYRWPVRQVIIIVTSDSTVITRDKVSGISEAAKIIRNTPFPEHDSSPDLRSVPVSAYGMEVSLIRQLCCSSPGFFPDGAAENVPNELIRKLPVSLNSEKNNVVIFAQLTSLSSTDVLSGHILEPATRRIAAGEKQGADYKDDDGYAFIVSPPSGSD